MVFSKAMMTGEKMMKEQHSFKLTIGGAICLSLASAIVYYLLIHDDLLPFSIHSFLSGFHLWFRDSHLMAIALLPVYLALVIFGTGMIGLYFGSLIERWVAEIRSHQKDNEGSFPDVSSE